MSNLIIYNNSNNNKYYTYLNMSIVIFHITYLFDSIGIGHAHIMQSCGVPNVAFP